MSKIEKLSISGVRSFGPLNRMYIEFETPLTLIVGYNGSGKTTIIECLKYATTGELPPNSKGGAFIHDPKLCGEREVLAQVKLKFKTPPDTNYVVTRNLQLTVKKTTRSQKTLEGSIMTMREGERSTMSGTNAHMDYFVPQVLGVAPAILDSVIFCHQDESLWPMSEPSVLKKKFDEIFEAQKYTKAIDNLKVLRKAKAEKLKKFQQEESHNKIMKEKGDKCEKTCRQLESDIEELRAKAVELGTQMKEAEAKSLEKREESAGILTIIQQLQGKRDRLDYRQTTIRELKATMNEMDEPDAVLQTALEQYEAKVERYEMEYEQTKTQYGECQQKLAETRQTLNGKLSERGKYQFEKEKHESQLQSRIDLIHKAAQLYGIRGFDGKLNDRQVKQFIERIQKLVSDKKQDLEQVQRENAEEKDKLIAAIAELEGRKHSRTQDRTTAKHRIGAIEKRLVAVQNDLNSLDIDEGAKAVLDASFQDVEQRLQKATTEFQTANIDVQLRQENDHLAQLESENDRLANEMMNCTKLTNDQSTLAHMEKKLSDKQRTLDTLCKVHNDKFSFMISASWKPETIVQDFQQTLEKKKKSLQEATSRRDNEETKLKQVQFTLSKAREDAKKQNEELDICKEAVRKALSEVYPGETPNIDNLPREIEDLEEETMQQEKDIALFDEMKIYYQKCQKALTKNNRCLLCERVFGEGGDTSKLIKRIREGLDDNEKEKAREELAADEARLGKLRMVRPKYDTYKRLLDEKPKLDAAIRESKQREEEINRRLEDLDQEVKQKKEEQQGMESTVQNTVYDIAHLYRDITKDETEVDRIRSEQQASGTIRSADEIQGLQETCKEQMKVAKNKINKLQADRQRLRDLVSSLELEKSRLSNQVTDATRRLERKMDFQKQVQALKDDMNNQKELIKRVDEELVAIVPEIDQAKATRDDSIQRGRAKEKTMTSERDEVVASAREISMLEMEIQNYIDRGGSEDLAASERAVQTLNQRIASIEKEMTELAARSNKLKEEIGNSDNLKKNIKDNLTYRSNLREVEELKREIATLESRNASEDYEHLVAEADAFEDMRNKLAVSRSSVLAKMGAKNEELDRLVAEWETDYSDAAYKYRESHINVETTKAAIEDMGRYSSALDAAIMQYHTIKMEEVNRIAGELWQSTYQGTDIDTILIRSDTESAPTTTTRRTYNYRVCMVKQDTEMDMRGRCSAGQRVLASIIIRLALAESFGTNCGIIALDEPTTNLDKDNIKSLAESLHSIINARKAQSNFQLIVITHDEEFLRHMRCSDFTERFWRVSRDSHQNSVIAKQNITKVV